MYHRALKCITEQLCSGDSHFPILSKAIQNLDFQTDAGKQLVSVTDHCSNSRKLDGRVGIFFLSDSEELRHFSALYCNTNSSLVQYVSHDIYIKLRLYVTVFMMNWQGSPSQLLDLCISIPCRLLHYLEVVKFLVNRNRAKVYAALVSLSFFVFLSQQMKYCQCSHVVEIVPINLRLGNKQLYLLDSWTDGVQLSDLCFGLLSRACWLGLVFLVHRQNLTWSKNAPNVRCSQQVWGMNSAVLAVRVCSSFCFSLSPTCLVDIHQRKNNPQRDANTRNR